MTGSAKQAKRRIGLLPPSAFPWIDERRRARDIINVPFPPFLNSAQIRCLLR
jgi:hypothetical protein